MSRTRRGGDEGFAVAAVLGIAALITVVAVGGFWLAMQSSHDSVRNRAETKAFQVANSGMELEMAAFDPRAIAANKYPYTSSTQDGTYTVTCREVATWEYLLTCVGRAEGTSETVTQRFMYLDLWNVNIAAGNNSSFGVGNSWNGNANINGPFYVRGDFRWNSGNPLMTGGPLLVKDGAVDMSGGSGQVGSAASPIKVYATNGVKPASAIGVKVFPVGNVVYTSVPDITLPRIDDQYMDNMLNRAKNQSVDNKSGSGSTVITECAGGDPTTYMAVLPGRLAAAQTVPACTSSWYKYRGASAGRAALGAGTHHLTIGSTSFGGRPGAGYPAGSAEHDDFAYDAATHTLWVEGTVFIDGNVTFDTWVNYRGNGTLVVNGNVFVYGTVQPDGGFAIDRSLGIVTPRDVTVRSCTLKAAVYSNGTLTLDQPATTFEGTVLADRIAGDAPNITLTQNAVVKDVLPESMPAVGGIPFTSTWSRY